MNWCCERGSPLLGHSSDSFMSDLRLTRVFREILVYSGSARRLLFHLPRRKRLVDGIVSTARRGLAASQARLRVATVRLVFSWPLIRLCLFEPGRLSVAFLSKCYRKLPGHDGVVSACQRCSTIFRIRLRPICTRLPRSGIFVYSSLASSGLRLRFTGAACRYLVAPRADS